MKRFGRLLVLGAICTAAGCTSYYRVHDPTTGKDYYTTDVKQERGGAATLKDSRTGNQVTVQNSETEKISEEEFNTGRYTQPTPKPAPTAAAQPGSATQTPAPANGTSTAGAPANPF
jgi:hypothetical protein